MTEIPEQLSTPSKPRLTDGLEKSPIVRWAVLLVLLAATFWVGYLTGKRAGDPPPPPTMEMTPEMEESV